MVRGRTRDRTEVRIGHIALLTSLVALAACGSKTGLLVPPPPPQLELAAGGGFTCVRFDNGLVRCWGENQYGQLGDGTRLRRPFAVASIGVTRATRIAAFASTACARLNDGTAQCWGSLGNDVTPTLTPTRVENLGGVVDLQPTVAATCARLSDGSVQCWGAATGRVLGFEVPEVERDAVLPPAPVPGLHDVVDLACDEYTCGAVLADGRIRFWGSLGDTGRDDWARPVTEPLLWPTEVRRLAVFNSFGLESFCALLRDGKLRCSQFEMDSPTEIRANARVIDPGVSDVTDVVTGGQFVCALDRSGEVWCWGSNDSGQLGDGTTTPRVLPVRVLGLTNVRSIAAGGAHVCVARGDRRVLCWGRNVDGQLGDGSFHDSSIPVYAEIGSVPSGEALHDANVTAPLPARACLPTEHISFDEGCTADRMTPICREQDAVALTLCDCHGNTFQSEVWPPTVPFSGHHACRPAPAGGQAVPCGPQTPIEGDACDARDRDQHAFCGVRARGGLFGADGCAEGCRCEASLRWHCDPAMCVDPNREYQCTDNGDVSRCVVGP